jgi:glutaredoxin
MGTKTTTKMCKWDLDQNVITCKEKDGSWKRYDLNVESLSGESKRIKEEKIAQMMAIAKGCYDKGKCKNPVELTMFELESCPACKAHKPVVENISARFARANLPIHVNVVPAKKNIDRFKAAGCNGTPCVVMETGKGDKILYEGNHGEIGAMAEILGLPNPLFTDLTKEKPKRLIS